MKGKVLILTQNDVDVLNTVEAEIAKQHLEIKKAPDFEHTLKELKKGGCLLIVIVMNNQNISEAKGQIKALRAVTSVPIAVVSEDEAGVPDRIALINEGADQLFEPPVTPEEISAASFALIRRFADFSKTMTPTTFYYSHGVLISHDYRKVFIGGIEIDMIRKEFDILSLLVRNQGMVLKHNHILKEVWGEDYAENDTEILWNQMCRVRSKIQIDPKLPHFIKTVPGIGYSFDPQYDPQ